jgi:hypothetical protein
MPVAKKYILNSKTRIANKRHIHLHHRLISDLLIEKATKANMSMI